MNPWSGGLIVGQLIMSLYNRLQLYIAFKRIKTCLILLINIKDYSISIKQELSTRHLLAESQKKGQPIAKNDYYLNDDLITS